MSFFGVEGNPWFGKLLEGDDGYDVFISQKNGHKTDISDMEYHDHFNTIDCCIMWAAITEKSFHLDGDTVIIQDPDGNIVKEYDDYDKIIEDLWDTLTDVPMDPETENMDANWFIFPKGTNREEIWYWFDEHHKKGVGYLING